MTLTAALAAGCALVALGLAALVLQPQILRKLIAFNVMGGGVFLLLLALAPRPGGGTADPIAQALVLTGIVIAVAATALGLLLARRYQEATGRDELDEQGECGTDD